MSYMKLIAAMTMDEKSTRDAYSMFVRAFSTCKKTDLNYAVVHGEHWTVTQIEGVIQILEKKVKEYDTLHRSKELTDSK